MLAALRWATDAILLLGREDLTTAVGVEQLVVEETVVDEKASFSADGCVLQFNGLCPVSVIEVIACE